MPTMSTKDFPTSPKGKSSKNLFSSLPAELRQHILHYTFDESYEKDLRENICWVSHERAAWGPKPYEDWKVFTFAVDDWDRQLRKQKAGWGEHIKQDLDYVLKKRKGEMQEDFKNWRVGGDWVANILIAAWALPGVGTMIVLIGITGRGYWVNNFPRSNGVRFSDVKL